MLPHRTQRILFNNLTSKSMMDVRIEDEGGSGDAEDKKEGEEE